MDLDRRIGPVPYALGGLVVALLLAVTIGLAYWKAVGTLQNQALHLADEMLARSHAISDQFDNTALKALLAQPDLQPCSPEGIATLRRLTLNSRALRVIGYVQDGRLLCSAYGVHGEGLPMGPVSYVSKNGFAIRSAVVLPLAGDTPFLSTTHQASGYTAFVVPGFISDILPGAPDASFGLFGASSHKLMVSRGDLRPPPDWLTPTLDASGTGTFRGAAHMVAMRQSPSFDYVAYAALPLVNAQVEFRANCLILAPLALVAGLALAALVVLQARRRRALPARLRQALHRDEIYLAYQPIVDLASGRWVGAEALARWRTRDGVLVPPDVFIAVAEEEGLIQAVTERVITLFARDAQALFAQYPDFRISLNFSAQDLVDPASVQRLQACLQGGSIRSHNVAVEITERALIHADAVRDNIRTLRQIGVSVAIDDFGTGYSGLSYLTSLELDSLKIDKLFIDTIGTDAVTKNVVSHIIDIARSMGLRMVAEGVETEAQARYLCERGVHCAQGWLYAKALPMADLLAGLAAQQTTPQPLAA
jgi:sensor c-di-GMP phosphodiesterase-like protein